MVLSTIPVLFNSFLSDIYHCCIAEKYPIGFFVNKVRNVCHLF